MLTSTLQQRRSGYARRARPTRKPWSTELQSRKAGGRDLRSASAAAECPVTLHLLTFLKLIFALLNHDVCGLVEAPLIICRKSHPCATSPPLSGSWDSLGHLTSCIPRSNSNPWSSPHDVTSSCAADRGFDAGIFEMRSRLRNSCGRAGDQAALPRRSTLGQLLRLVSYRVM